MSSEPRAETPRKGRPRSEEARDAVLKAVDDLLVEVGYAAMTMKSIAESAGVGRQTVYRWWSNKAEILLEACVDDAAEELSHSPRGGATAQLTGYLRVLAHFLTTSAAGLGYRALVGEAQHDPEIRELVAAADVLGAPTRQLLTRVGLLLPGIPAPRLATAQLIGPLVYDLLTTGNPMSPASQRKHVDALVRAWS